MFFVVRSNDSFNFPLGLIKYIIIVVIVIVTSLALEIPNTSTTTKTWVAYGNSRLAYV